MWTWSCHLTSLDLICTVYKMKEKKMFRLMISNNIFALKFYNSNQDKKIVANDKAI